MILTDREIQTFLANRQIIIKPEPKPVRYSSTSVDLTLAKHIRIWDFNQINKTEGEIITPGPEFKYAEFRDKYTKKKIITDQG